MSETAKYYRCGREGCTATEDVIRAEAPTIGPACTHCGRELTALTVYEALKAAGVPLDSHESDLYALVTADSARIVREYGLRGALLTTFTSQIDGKLWYDLPFKFDPWWTRRAGRA